MNRSERSRFAFTNQVANRVLIPVLTSAVGPRLGRRLAVLEYDGRRTGKHHRLVTGYRTEGSGVRIDVGMAQHKRWWRNFSTPQPLHLRLAGHDRQGRGRVVQERGRVHVLVDLDP